MPPVKKPKEPKLPQAVIDAATARVEADPRGAPITLAADPEPPKPVVPVSRCALDEAKVNSMMVMLQYPSMPSYVHFQTPDGEQPVPKEDAFWSLPLGAEIKKVGASTFVAVQREPAIDKPPLVCTSAVECIRQFKRHFHDAKE